MRGRDQFFTSVTAAAVLILFGCDSMLPMGEGASVEARPTRASDAPHVTSTPDTRRRTSTERAPTPAHDTPSRSQAPVVTRPTPDGTRASPTATPDTTARTATAPLSPVTTEAAPGESVAVARADADAPEATANEGRPATAESGVAVKDAEVARAAPAANAADEGAPSPAGATEEESGGSFWTWFFGIVLMAGVAFGAWLLLQPPWKRWRWYWALRAEIRKQWLKYFTKGGDTSARKPKRDSVVLTAGRAPAERPTIPESQMKTVAEKPATEAVSKPAQKKPSKKYGAPLKSRDTTRTKRRNAQVVDDPAAPKKSGKRKKRQTGITLPVVPLSKRNSKNN